MKKIIFVLLMSLSLTSISFSQSIVLEKAKITKQGEKFWIDYSGGGGDFTLSLKGMELLKIMQWEKSSANVYYFILPKKNLAGLKVQITDIPGEFFIGSPKKSETIEGVLFEKDRCVISIEHPPFDPIITVPNGYKLIKAY